MFKRLAVTALAASLAASAQQSPLPPSIRVVVVTKGPDWESPAAVAERAPLGIQVVMSTGAWSDYEIPGSPYFVLVDGARRRLGSWNVHL